MKGDEDSEATPASGDEEDDGSGDEEDEVGACHRRRKSRPAPRVSKHGPRALSKREILKVEDPDNEGLQWLKKRGELSTRVQARLNELVPMEKALDRLWKQV